MVLRVMQAPKCRMGGLQNDMAGLDSDTGDFSNDLCVVKVALKVAWEELTMLRSSDRSHGRQRD